jgi:hypothetical protein
VEAADDVWNYRTKNVGQQGNYKEGQEDQANRIAASRHEFLLS